LRQAVDKTHRNKGKDISNRFESGQVYDMHQEEREMRRTISFASDIDEIVLAVTKAVKDKTGQGNYSRTVNRLVHLGYMTWKKEMKGLYVPKYSEVEDGKK
jgi:hypothetical protein